MHESESTEANDVVPLNGSPQQLSEWSAIQRMSEFHTRRFRQWQEKNNALESSIFEEPLPPMDKG